MSPRTTTIVERQVPLTQPVPQPRATSTCTRIHFEAWRKLEEQLTGGADAQILRMVGHQAWDGDGPSRRERDEIVLDQVIGSLKHPEAFLGLSLETHNQKQCEQRRRRDPRWHT